MELLILMLLLLGLLALRVPVAFSLLISAMAVFALLGLNPLIAVQRRWCIHDVRCGVRFCRSQRLSHRQYHDPNYGRKRV